MNINVVEKSFMPERFRQILTYEYIVSALAFRSEIKMNLFKLLVGYNKLLFKSVDLLLLACGCDKISLSAPAFLLFDNSLDTRNFLYLVLVLLFYNLLLFTLFFHKHGVISYVHL